MSDETGARGTPATSAWRRALRGLAYVLFAISLLVALFGFFGSNQLIQWSGIAAASWANVIYWLSRGSGLRMALVGAVVLTITGAAIIIFKR